MKHAAIAVALLAAACGGSDTQKVTVNFKGMVGSQAFSCTQTYAALGTAGTTWTPEDFRLYVHNFRLVDAGGKEYAVTLDNDGVWQDGTVALLDFEDRTGTCQNGTPETNFKVTRTADSGSNTGLKFTIGVPDSENHLQVDSQKSPLNVSTLYWSWTSGYKFLDIDGSFLFHLGSAGCTANDANDPTKGFSTCSEPNRPEIALSSFDVSKNTVILDVKSLFAQSDLTQGGMMGGCMSMIGDAACTGVMSTIGLSSSAQTFVRMQ